MVNFFERLIGKTAIDQEKNLAERLKASGAKNVEVVGRGAIVTSKEDLEGSETVSLMRAHAKKIISANNKAEDKSGKE